jgi:outer membrane protein TolC
MSFNIRISKRWLIVFAICTQQTFSHGEQPTRAEDAPGHVRISAGGADRPVRKPVPKAGGDWPKAPASKPRKVIQAQQTVIGEAPSEPPQSVDAHTPKAAGEDDDPLKFLLDQNVTPIDLYSALQLAGERNPQILLAQQRVVEAVALRQLAAAQFLPTLNLGTSVDSHWGVLQQSNGNILSVRRESVFVGSGANAIAAGSVNIPGVLWTLNVSDAIYNSLVSRQDVDRSTFESQATRQDVLLDVALAYSDLVRAEGGRSISIVTRNDANELARITAAYEQTGEGRKADADRARTEQLRREAEIFTAEATVVRSSAALCKLLHLDPTLRLHPTDNQVVPKSIVPDPIPLSELLAIALMYRPELNERRAAVARSLLSLKGAKTLPFSPTVLVGFSTGGFGGGSDLAAQPTGTNVFARGEPRFGSFANREDLDAMAYWTLQNLGVGNKAQIDAARSRLSSADLELLVTLDRIRSEVAAAYARTHARFAQIRSCELAIKTGQEAFDEDMNRIRGREGLPLEVVDSLRLLARSRIEYLNAIVDYNKAQFQLYVSLGKPPADLLMRPAPEPEENRIPLLPGQ